MNEILCWNIPKRVLFIVVFAFFITLARADLINSVKKIKPSVILVGTFSQIDSPRFYFRGTGFVVALGNHAITNAHVLALSPGDEYIKKIFVQVWAPPKSWNMRFAEVISVDSVHDLALLSFDGSAVPSVRLSNEKPKEGSSVAFMGFPIGGALGFSHVTHRATISSIASMALPAGTAQQLNERAVSQLRLGSFDIFQLDGTAYPGNSGGPIFDPDSGTVIGVINSVLVKGSRESALSDPSGISYGIPVEYVTRLLKEKSEMIRK